MPLTNPRGIVLLSNMRNETAATKASPKGPIITLKQKLDLHKVQKACGFDTRYNPAAEIGSIGLETSHGYDAEYLTFLNYMLKRDDYCLRDFFCYARIASSDVDWLYQGHEFLFEGTKLEADKNAERGN